MKRANNFQTAKVQPQAVALSFCLIFCKYQPVFAYESVKYFLFSVFVSMSRPSSIYVVYMRSIFHFHFHVRYISYNLIKIETLAFLHIFRICPIIFNDKRGWRKQILRSKSSASGCVLSFSWFFSQFQPDALVKKSWKARMFPIKGWNFLLTKYLCYIAPTEEVIT